VATFWEELIKREEFQFHKFCYMRMMIN